MSKFGALGFLGTNLASGAYELTRASLNGVKNYFVWEASKIRDRLERERNHFMGEGI